MPSARSTNRWVLNRSNQPILSTREGVSPEKGIAHYNNLSLLPYVGRQGWVIEYPEFDVSGACPSSVQSWVRVTTNPALLFKLLKQDRGLYRARCVFVPDSKYLYPVAAVAAEDFRWDHSMLRATYAADRKGSEQWRVERLQDIIFDARSPQGRAVWEVVLRSSQPSWSPSDESECYRLVEISVGVDHDQ